jgi:hypothetical protein
MLQLHRRCIIRTDSTILGCYLFLSNRLPFSWARCRASYGAMKFITVVLKASILSYLQMVYTSARCYSKMNGKSMLLRKPKYNCTQAANVTVRASIFLTDSVNPAKFVEEFVISSLLSETIPPRLLELQVWCFMVKIHHWNFKGFTRKWWFFNTVVFRPVVRQWLSSDHVGIATDTNATVAQQQRNGVFCADRAEML